VSALIVLVKILAVFALLGGVLLVLKRTQGGGVVTKTRTKAIELRGTTRLGKSASITVVRVNGEELLLGVTEQQVTLLSRHTPEDEPVTEAPATPTARTIPELVDLLTTQRADVPEDELAAVLRSARERTSSSATDGPVALSPQRTDARNRPEQPWTRLLRATRQPLASRGAGR
jgi:flagellar biogenesis protein FliO